MTEGLTNDPFARFGAFIYRRRWYVLAAWLVAIVVCAPFAGKANGVLKAGGIQVPGSGSAVAENVLATRFDVGELNNAAIVFHSSSLTVGNKAFKDQVEAAAARVAHAKGVRSVTTYYRYLAPYLVSKDRHTTIVFATMKGNESTTQTYIKGIRDAVSGVTLDHYVTGDAAINHDFSVTSDKDLRHAEVLTFVLVLLLLLLTFRTVVSAVLPLALAGVAVVTGTAAIYAIGRMTDTSVFALNVASMIGLGLAIDFSLIVVSRFREELSRNSRVEWALAGTMATAGRSIVYSGVTVVLGMLVLTVLVDLMVIRSISIGVLVVAGTALLAGVTMLPALLAVLGPRVEKWRVLKKRAPKAAAEGFWYRWSRMIMRRPWAFVTASLALIVLLALPAVNLRLLGSTSKLLPHDSESARGTALLNSQFGQNLLTPIQIVLKTKPGRVFTPTILNGLDKLTAILEQDPRAASGGVSSLANFMAAEPRDGRYQHLKPTDFWPEPKLNVAPNEPTAGAFLTNIISVWVPRVPSGPAYMGFANFTFQPGTDRNLNVASALQVYRINRGRLTVTAGSTTTLWRKADSNQRHKGVSIDPTRPVMLLPGDQLVVPVNSKVRLRVEGSEPVQMTVAIAFHVRPGVAPQSSWLDGQPSDDPFEGITRTVVGGGVAGTFPTSETHIILDLIKVNPGVVDPRQLHPGPELIVTKSGTLSVYSEPQILITGKNGEQVKSPYNTPTPVPPHGQAFIQAYSLLAAVNKGKVDAWAYSLRVLTAGKPQFTLVGLRPFARQFVNLDSGSDYAVVNVVPRYWSYDKRQEHFVSDIRSLDIPSVRELRGVQASVGGPTANFIDFKGKLYGRFPFIVAAVLLLTFFVLMMFFQSVFLPLKAILMNLATVLATYGVLVLIFQNGWGAGLFGFTPVGAVGVITPAILFVILFSLSTDYEVFMLSRIREYYLETGDNEEAVASGLQRTGRVVTSAGLILIAVFGSFAVAGVITIKEIGLGLAIGVLIDTTLVRSIMVPATMRLAGSINWVMPEWLKRFVPELREGPTVGDASTDGPAA